MLVHFMTIHLLQPLHGMLTYFRRDNIAMSTEQNLPLNLSQRQFSVRMSNKQQCMRLVCPI